MDGRDPRQYNIEQQIEPGRPSRLCAPSLEPKRIIFSASKSLSARPKERSPISPADHKGINIRSRRPPESVRASSQAARRRPPPPIQLQRGLLCIAKTKLGPEGTGRIHCRIIGRPKLLRCRNTCSPSPITSGRLTDLGNIAGAFSTSLAPPGQCGPVVLRELAQSGLTSSPDNRAAQRVAAVRWSFRTRVLQFHRALRRTSLPQHPCETTSFLQDCRSKFFCEPAADASPGSLSVGELLT